MPFTKPYPPTEIDYQDWNDLGDYYAGKTVTKIVDLNGKGDYSTIQEAVDALPTTDAGEVWVKGDEHVLSKAVPVKDREDLVIRGVGGPLGSRWPTRSRSARKYKWDIWNTAP